ncbi:hypothetical protein LTR08_001051 [Meristemomyces frigidus]|nr:hypothetical protein LTR08_001051 [Meristemomyces frigidus]
MAAQQKRLLTAAKSKLTKLEPSELSHRLRTTPATWSDLPLPTRQHLYTLLPAPRPGEAAHDVDVNPLMTGYRTYIEEELGEWHADVKGGLEAKKWRQQALEAGRVRGEGGWEEWRDVARAEYWGQREVGAGGKGGGGELGGEVGEEREADVVVVGGGLEEGGSVESGGVQ